ncbi:MAG: hypothetical protein IJP22_00945 [Clostridia bacterium]|nr:hypothetical protein [Clostridia bacterium]
MDNLKYYNDSLAYDFEMFMPKSNVVPKEKENIVVMPKNRTTTKKRQRAATKALSSSAFAVMATVFILAALCGNIALRLQINEVNSQINDMKHSLNELDSERTSLEVEMQRRISYSNIEFEATQMGMQKLSKDQVTYIKVNDKNAAKTADGEIIVEE